MQTPIFLHDWSSPEAVFDDFSATRYHDGVEPFRPEGVEILLASYTYENYSGNAFVLFRKEGKYYEVNGSHCSCYGLEGQWVPEEAVLEELHKRVTVGSFGRNWDSNEFATELLELLERIKEANLL